jgi:two-component system, OmpR family, KDP operon response regulator KdpE
MPSAAPTILLIEDELPIRKFLGASLVSAGYLFDEATTGSEGLRGASRKPPDLVILDLGLPDMDGQEVLKQLREWFTSPIIVLSARDQEQQKVTALDSGADDYLTKPFSTVELLARIRVALRHSARGDESDSTVLERGDLKIDLSARSVFAQNKEVHLTPIEFKLLASLVRHPGKVLTHQQLLKEVWGPHHTDETHYLRVFMTSLRRKLEADPARNIFSRSKALDIDLPASEPATVDWIVSRARLGHKSPSNSTMRDSGHQSTDSESLREVRAAQVPMRLPPCSLCRCDVTILRKTLCWYDTSWVPSRNELPARSAVGNCWSASPAKKWICGDLVVYATHMCYSTNALASRHGRTCIDLVELPGTGDHAG